MRESIRIFSGSTRVSGYSMRLILSNRSRPDLSWTPILYILVLKSKFTGGYRNARFLHFDTRPINCIELCLCRSVGLNKRPVGTVMTAGALHIGSPILFHLNNWLWVPSLKKQCHFHKAYKSQAYHHPSGILGNLYILPVKNDL